MPWSHSRSLATSVPVVAGVLLAAGLASGGVATGARTVAARRPAFICRHAPNPNRSRRERREKLVCKTGPAGPTGAQGPPGPVGAAGPAAGPGETIIPRTVIPFTTNFMTDGGNVQNLAKIGPIHIDGLCRRTFFPGTGGGNSNPTYPDPRLPTKGGESEAQILVWSETGSTSFKGMAGPRDNIPAGPPAFTTEFYSSGQPNNGSVTGGTDRPVNDPVAGEGDHLFLAASNEHPDEDRATDPASNSPGQDIFGGRVIGLSEYPGFHYASGPITTSEGHILLARVFAGFDVLGVYGECVYGGVIRSIA